MKDNAEDSAHFANPTHEERSIESHASAEMAVEELARGSLFEANRPRLVFSIRVTLHRATQKTSSLVPHNFTCSTSPCHPPPTAHIHSAPLRLCVFALISLHAHALPW